jgi:hypothetical protein
MLLMVLNKGIIIVSLDGIKSNTENANFAEI